MSRGATLAVGIAGALVLWQALVWATGVPPFILPGPVKVVTALLDNATLVAENTAITAFEIALGFVVGTTLGVATALSLMVSPVARAYVLPFLVFMQAIPVFALAPLLTLWMGYGLLPKIVMATLIIYFPVASNFYDGLRRTDRGLLDLARTMGATPLRVLTHLRVPAALPALGSGLKLAAVYAPIGAVFAEWVGASRGLGYLILYANGRSKIDLLFAALIVLAAMTVLLHWGVSWLVRRMAWWAPETTGTG